MAIVKATRVAELAIVRAAKQYIELGIEPVPVYPRDKAAVVDWKIAPPITRENVVNRFREGQNIGVRLGRRSAGLADVDLDCDEALRLAPMFLPPTSRISGRASSQRAHWFYRSDLHQNEDTAALTFKHPGTNEMLVELRIGADGEDHDAMTVVPPSIHSKTGENIVWYEEGDIAWVDGATLKLAVTKIAVGCMVLRYYPDEGGRHGFWLVVDGCLTRAGWSKEERKEFIEAVATVAGDDEVKDRVRVGDRTENKQKVPGLPALRKVLGKEVADRIDEWLGSDRRAHPFPDDGRPVIEVRPGTLRQQVDAAEEALVTCAGTPVYLQAGRLVQPVIEEADAARGRRTTVARISPLSSSSLRYQLSRAANWVRRSKNSLTPADPPRDVADSLLAHGSWTLLKELAGIIETPTLRPDFTVLSEPGYDPATGLLLVNPPPMPNIPEAPDRADAEDALRLLKALLDEFPFVDGASRSVALSALMTPVVRGALKRAPLHVFCGPAAGTVKSYLADLVAAIITGRECPTLSAADKQEELEKRLAGSVLSGQPIISLDNINGELGGSFLCQLLTQDRLEIRPLGQTGNLNVESRATVLANGNNISIAGDLARRSIQCSLDPQMERPELREFKGDPFKAIVADRGKYVAAVLTIIRAHVVAHRPAKVKPFASFEDWSRLVRAPLMWLGCDDPVETMDQLRVEDPHTTQLNDLLIAWKEAIQQTSDGRVDTSISSEPMTARELCGTNVYNFTRALIEATGGRDLDDNASPLRVGKFLEKHKNRICNSLKICGQRDRHDKITRWWLAYADGSRVTKDNCGPRTDKTDPKQGEPGFRPGY